MVEQKKSSNALVAYKAALPAVTEDGLSRYISEVNRFPVLEAGQERELANKWVENGDLDAAQKLVTSHLRLVVKVAMGFRGYGLPVADLVSEGNIGLMQAVKRFDPDKGFRLSTYAMWWIRASVQEYILRSWSLVKMGTSAAHKKLFFNLRKARARIAGAESGHALSPDEVSQIAIELNVPERDVIEMSERMYAHDSSMQAPIGGEDEGGTLEHIIADEGESHDIAIANAQEAEQNRQLLQAAMAEVLNERERDIIVKRTMSEKQATLDDLSHIYKVSRERIRQIEARAIEKLRDFMNRRSSVGGLS